MLNQGLNMVDEHGNESMVGASTNVGGFNSPGSEAYPPPTWTSIPTLGFQQMRTLSQSFSDVAETLTSLVPKQRSEATAPADGNLAEFGASSVQRSSNINSFWPWTEVGSNNMKRNNNINNINGDHHQDHLSIAAVKMKKVKGRRKVREPRFCFKTMSDVDVLDDGYKWRKYGQKVVKNTQHPRSYYRCTQDNCRVKKRVERLAEDPRMVITTYEGRHVHSPSRDEEDNPHAPFHINFFW
ncbi:hypothetical protein H6P81_001354 [Aristolochia fimbriata]|uniref:WRKY domain-containing protein n=1 Tax=Aristolochia fimbriata TaxID=158543 RepID=A0AAV7F7W0_ARIFI|nr:hypothetical protein H6P81_001354 [Aristolochia fimbriata]